MEIFAGTIKDSSTKSEVNPFQLKTVPNWILDRFSRTIGKISTQNESGSFPPWLLIVSFIWGKEIHFGSSLQSATILDFYIGRCDFWCFILPLSYKQISFKLANSQSLNWTFMSEGVKKTHLLLILKVTYSEQCGFFSVFCCELIPFWVQIQIFGIFGTNLIHKMSLWCFDTLRCDDWYVFHLVNFERIF